MNLHDMDVDELLLHLDTDYPQGYNYKILRQAADLIRFYRGDSDE
jgi:hypothetical protein